MENGRRFEEVPTKWLDEALYKSLRLLQEFILVNAILEAIFLLQRYL